MHCTTFMLIVGKSSVHKTIVLAHVNDAPGWLVVIMLIVTLFILHVGCVYTLWLARVNVILVNYLTVYIRR